MNTDYIRYVKMIAQEGNVSRAAAALFISQPALLKALNKIEARLKIKLFTRETANDPYRSRKSIPGRWR